MSKWINGLASMRERRIHEALWQRFSVTPAVHDAVTWAEGSSVPAAGLGGYAPGCRFLLSNASLGMAPEWVNFGSASSCAFYPVGEVYGYGIKVAGGPVTTAGGDTAEVISLQGRIHDTDLAIVGHEVSNDADQIVAAIADEGAINITVDVDPSTVHGYVYAAVRNRCVPEWDIFAAGTHTTAGGGTGEAITVTGVLATDIAFACYAVTNDADKISDVLCSANTVTVTMDNDPSTAHALHYVVLRPRGTFKPSHYIAYAGTGASTAAASTALTVTGALATDVALGWYTATDDTDYIKSVAVTADTLTITHSTTSSTGHTIGYVILRAY